MRLPILELPGYEADDVIGAIAVQAAKQNVEVLIISNDKDMMQLVNGGVRILRTGSGGAKSDVIVDKEKVKEILGVAPEKVIDVMALMGDTVDNIPGAKDPNERLAEGERRKPGIGEVGARHAAGPKLTAQLADPDSKEHQQPPYAVNWRRSVNSEIAVQVTSSHNSELLSSQ